MSTEVPHPPSEDVTRPQRTDRVVGLLILSVAFLAALSISWWAKLESTPELSVPPDPPTSAGVVGFPERVEPIANLERARGLTPRHQLRGIVADGVRPDGTVDVQSRGRVRYVFQSAPGEGPQPPREPDTLARRHYCGKQAVEITEQGIGAEPDQTLVSCPDQVLEPLPEPRCTPKDIWDRAVARGIPTDKPARIEYYRARVGPAWRFVYAGQHPTHRFALYGDCDRVLTNEEAISVPH